MNNKLVAVAITLDINRATIILADGTIRYINRSSGSNIALITRISEGLLQQNPFEFSFTDDEASSIEFFKESGLQALYKVTNDEMTRIMNSWETDQSQTLKDIATLNERSERLTTVNQLEEVESTHKVIGVVKDSDGETSIIPEIENLASHFKHAINMDFSTGVNNLIKRIAKVAKDRLFSVKDLLIFLKQSELPITITGDIIGFKALNKHPTTKDLFVDIHTKKVPQKVGTRVFMCKTMVDPDRRNDCSNGLHIASRSYLSGFQGHVCTMVLIKPEDVIAVPQYDATKMRVSSYDVVGLLTDSEYQQVMDKDSCLNTFSGMEKLLDVLNMKLPTITDLTEIRGQQGNDLVLSKVKPKAKKKVAKKTNKKIKTVTVKDSVEKDFTDTVKKLNSTISNAAEFNSNCQTLKTYTASHDVLVKAAKDALSYKRKSKKGWKYLGVSENLVKTIMKLSKD